MKPEGFEMTSANIHITDRCNYRCRFCYSRSCTPSAELTPNQWKWKIEDLGGRGITKINLAGGEPLLYPRLPEVIQAVKDAGMTTSVVTNGSLVTEEFFESTHGSLDWIGLSLDSVNEGTEVLLGRHCGSLAHLGNLRTVAGLAEDYGVKVKLNITVTKLSLNDDFGSLISEMMPDRVKFLQVTEVMGMNEEAYGALRITSEEFEGFRARHASIKLKNGLSPVFETEQLVAGTYLMLNAEGKIRMNAGAYEYYDYNQFWEQKLYLNLDQEGYKERGGNGYW